MKSFVITALLLPAICLAKTATEDDMLAQLLSMKASGTKHNAAAEYTYDEKKGAVVSILELVQEMMGDKADYATKLAKDIADADQKVIELAAKTKLAKTAQRTAQNELDEKKQDLTDAEGVEGTAKAEVETLTKAQSAAEEASNKANTALKEIATFLCQNTTAATQALCSELAPAAVTIAPVVKKNYKVRSGRNIAHASNSLKLELLCSGMPNTPQLAGKNPAKPDYDGSPRKQEICYVEDLNEAKKICDEQSPCEGFVFSNSRVTSTYIGFGYDNWTGGHQTRFFKNSKDVKTIRYNGNDMYLS